MRGWREARERERFRSRFEFPFASRVFRRLQRHILASNRQLTHPAATRDETRARTRKMRADRAASERRPRREDRPIVEERGIGTTISKKRVLFNVFLGTRSTSSASDLETRRDPGRDRGKDASLVGKRTQAKSVLHGARALVSVWRKTAEVKRGAPAFFIFFSLSFFFSLPFSCELSENSSQYGG